MSKPKTITVFEAVGDIDQTEGRGGLRTVQLSSTVDKAIAYAKTAGVMGSAGSVIEWAVTVDKDGSVAFDHEVVWGYRQWGSHKVAGFLDYRDVIESAEYAEYLRLRDELGMGED